MMSTDIVQVFLGNGQSPRFSESEQTKLEVIARCAEELSPFVPMAADELSRMILAMVSRLNNGEE